MITRVHVSIFKVTKLLTGHTMYTLAYYQQKAKARDI